MGLKLVYFSYPYSDNPRARTEEIKTFVQLVLAKHGNIVPVIPHLMFDAIYNFPEGYSHPEFSVMEFEVISRCDCLAYDPNEVSSGVRWEVAFAKWLGKPVLTFKELMENGFEG
ncbi:MAG: hypothetical protein QXQ50_02140 [Candidatus Bathyarchaeia archaeon]